MIVTDVIVIFIIIALVLCIIYQDGWTALMYASRKGHMEVVKLLLDHGANKDLQDEVRIIYVVFYVCMYVCMYGWMDGWMDVSMNVKRLIHPHTRKHTYTYIYSYVYMCIYICTCSDVVVIVFVVNFVKSVSSL